MIKKMERINYKKNKPIIGDKVNCVIAKEIKAQLVCNLPVIVLIAH